MIYVLLTEVLPHVILNLTTKYFTIIQIRTVIAIYRRLQASLLIVLMLISLTACTSTPAQPTAQPTPPASQPAAKPAFSTDQPRYSWSFASQTVTADSKNVEIANGSLILKKNGDKFADQGEYISPEIGMPKFNWLVPSWKIKAAEGSTVAVDFQVKTGDKWSNWYPMGIWGTGTAPASVKGTSDEIGSVDVDTLQLKKDASSLRFRLSLKSTNPTATPEIQTVHWVTRDLFASGSKPASAQPLPEVDLKVPMRSQMVEDPSIANSICSPTSLAMALEYFGTNQPTADVAKKVFDHKAQIYGNWTLNVAYAGQLGYNARVDYFDGFQQVATELQKGNVVIASVKYSAGQLDNAAIASTSGHLILIRGLTKKDGKDYVIVNDAAAKSVAEVRREYRVDQFMNVWRGVVYVIGK